MPVIPQLLNVPFPFVPKPPIVSKADIISLTLVSDAHCKKPLSAILVIPLVVVNVTAD